RADRLALPPGPLRTTAGGGPAPPARPLSFGKPVHGRRDHRANRAGGPACRRQVVQPDLSAAAGRGVVPPAVPRALHLAHPRRPPRRPAGRLLPRLRAETGRVLRLVLRGGAGVPPAGDRLAADGGRPQLGPAERVRVDPLRVP